MSDTLGYVKLNKPDGMIEMYFQTESQALDRAWEHWQEKHPDYFSDWPENEKKAAIESWKQSGFPEGYWVSYSMSDADFFGEESDEWYEKHYGDDDDDEEE